MRRSYSDYMLLSIGDQLSADVTLCSHCGTGLDPPRRLAEIHFFAVNLRPCGNAKCIDSWLQQVRPTPPGAPGSASGAWLCFQGICRPAPRWASAESSP